MSDQFTAIDQRHMNRALALAERGQGRVEPNPMVGCVIARGETILAEGWHQAFGGPHAEVEAIANLETDVTDATMYVTLEPCCHHGKTPPCTETIAKSAIQRVVVAISDPFPEVDGGGVEQLRKAGVSVEVGLLEQRAQRINAPYLKLVQSGRPWVIAKWAMTLDGKIATSTGDSKWISNEASRKVVHELRGRVDAIIVGRGTAEADDPLLTARPAGPRVATRVVADSRAALSLDSQLVRTAGDTPVVVACGGAAPKKNRERLSDAGCRVMVCEGESRRERLNDLFDLLGREQVTNVLVEGGAELLGSLLEEEAMDEVYAFVAPKLIGGRDAPSPVGGTGVPEIALAQSLHDLAVERIGDDVLLVGRFRCSR